MMPRREGDGWTVAIDPAWPGFAGHFPGDPIVPAAELIGWAIMAAGGSARRVVKARFLAAARPGDHLHLTAAAVGGQHRVAIVRGAERIAEVVLAD